MKKLATSTCGLLIAASVGLTAAHVALGAPSVPAGAITATISDRAAYRRRCTLVSCGFTSSAPAPSLTI